MSFLGSKKIALTAIGTGNASSGGSAVKLVLVSVNEKENLENCPIGGEFCFYSTQTFNTFRDMCDFISDYCNSVAHQGYPIHFSGSAGAKYVSETSSIFSFGDDELFIGGEQISISEVESAFEDNPSEFYIKYFDI